jgi:deazaflavin-dependent oxidoreductase (nitroreductase family)
MTTTDLHTENQLRQGFKVFNRFMMLMWRLGLGPMVNFWPEVGGRIMVLAHTGRKPGWWRYTPVNYTVADGEVYCTAAFSASDWYSNIQAQPEVEVWLPDGWWAGRAEDVPHDERRIPLMRQLMIDTGFAARAAGIDPVSMSNEELAAATATYRLVHIRRSAARTGPGGPGDLAWVWPVVAFILLPFVLWRRKR